MYKNEHKIGVLLTVRHSQHAFEPKGGGRDKMSRQQPQPNIRCSQILDR